MNKIEAKKRIEKLRQIIDKYRYAYHVLDKPLVCDAVNDSLKHELQTLEDEYPDLVTDDSPTQRVGGKPLAKFRKVTHSTQMLSLTDAFDNKELKNWEKRNLRKYYNLSAQSEISEKFIKQKGFDYYTELKMDGLAVTLIYENGILKTGATRAMAELAKMLRRI